MFDTTTAKLLPLLSKLGTYFKVGMDHYVTLKASGEEVNPDILAAFIYGKMVDWNPTVGGHEILDDDIRLSAARLLGGVIVNLTKASP